MGRKRTATEEPQPDVFDQQIAAQAAQVVQDEAAATAMPEDRPVNGHVANPSSTPRPRSHAQAVRKLPGKLGIKAGDLVVEMVDFGNAGGVGIRVVTPEGRQLTDEEKALIRTHIKGEEGEQTGFTWQGKDKIWHKEIRRQGEKLEDIPRNRAVAIRLDAESRVEKLAEALGQHLDPVGFAARIEQQREQAASRDRIPD